MMFYKYKCKKCGKRYVELPSVCKNCGTELKFLCPCTPIYLPIEKISKNCEEIFEPRFSFFGKSLQRQYEEKIKGLNILLSEKQKEITELREEKQAVESELNKSKLYIMFLKSYNGTLLRWSEFAEYENTPSQTKINKDTIDAVFYAMKKAHPDNGGNEEDFIRFKKCYEELIKEK